jgi:hypothetical protein
MADIKDGMGPVTHHMSAIDDDMDKTGRVEEKAVASVALGKSTLVRRSLRQLSLISTSILYVNADYPKLLLSKHRSRNYGRRA